MRPELVEGVGHLNHRKALVFGERGIAQIIANQLKEEGFQPILLSDFTSMRLPSVADPNSLQDLRNLLIQFREISEGQGVIHPGTTHWAERPELSTIAEELGLTAICPAPRVLARFGNKLSFLMEAEDLGIPNLVQSYDPMHSIREIEDFIRRTDQRYPFILKAVRGGGSLGLFVVQDATTLERNLPLWFDQLRRNLGEVILFAERYLEGARHIVLPFARFRDGSFQSFPPVDSSLQSRYRKIVEFCPAERVETEMLDELVVWAQKLAEHSGFVGVGAFEFLVEHRRGFLIEGLPRLNTCFNLWSHVSETSAVAWQLATLENDSLPAGLSIRNPAPWTGVSMRVYAEDSLFHLPQPGKILELSEKRIWSFANASAELHMNYKLHETVHVEDSGILGIIFVKAHNRKQLMTVARGVLNEMWISGSLQTNERFLEELLIHPWVKEGVFHAGFIDEEFVPASRPPAEIVQLAASILIQHPMLLKAPEEKVYWAVDDRWIKSETLVNETVDWVRGKGKEFSYWYDEGRPGISGWVQLKDGSQIQLSASPMMDRWLVRVGHWFMGVRRVHSTPRPSGGARPKPRFSALVSGRVHAILFRRGTDIPPHEPIVIVESLGIFIPHALSAKIRITEWKIKAEDFVQAGQELAEIDWSSEDPVMPQS